MFNLYYLAVTILSIRVRNAIINIYYCNTINITLYTRPSFFSLLKYAIVVYNTKPNDQTTLL